jgi:hypothetical protein
MSNSAANFLCIKEIHVRVQYGARVCLTYKYTKMYVFLFLSHLSNLASYSIVPLEMPLATIGLTSII